MSILVKRTDVYKNDTVNKGKKRVRFNLNNDINHDNNNNINNYETHKKLTSLQIAHRRNVLGTKDMFLFNYALPLQLNDDIISYKMKLKMMDNEFNNLQNHPLMSKTQNVKNENNNNENKGETLNEPPATKKRKISNNNNNDSSTQIILRNNNMKKPNRTMSLMSNNLNRKKKSIKPEWHRPWKLYKVISGHLGWVGSVCVDHSNEFFVTGSADRTIKIWDLASGSLKLTLTGHISHVRGIAISSRHPYMFSCGEDKQVRCWDLETNKVIRNYHGHLSGVYCISLHPTLNILFTGGRDSTCRVWDIRTKTQIMVLSGHKHTVHSLATQSFKPQIITGSHDKTIRTWDLRQNGKTITILTHHKKSIRSLSIHPSQYTFISGAADNLKVWKCPNSNFLRNFNCKPNGIVECLCINQDNVVVSGLQNGYLKFWDYSTGYKFQEIRLDPQPGSLDSEAAILAASFDITGTRLITCEADKTIKMFKPDINATPQTHPIHYKQNTQTIY